LVGITIQLKNSSITRMRGSQW